MADPAPNVPVTVRPRTVLDSIPGLKQIIMLVAIAGAIAPIAEAAIAEVVGPCRVGEQRDDAVLGATLGARGSHQAAYSDTPGADPLARRSAPATRLGPDRVARRTCHKYSRRPKTLLDTFGGARRAMFGPTSAVALPRPVV